MLPPQETERELLMRVYEDAAAKRLLRSTVIHPFTVEVLRGIMEPPKHLEFDPLGKAEWWLRNKNLRLETWTRYFSEKWFGVSDNEN